MSNAQQMIDFEKLSFDCDDEIFLCQLIIVKKLILLILFHVSYDHCRIRKLQLRVNILQLLQNSVIIDTCFFCHETEIDVIINMQCRLITDDQ